MKSINRIYLTICLLPFFSIVFTACLISLISLAPVESKIGFFFLLKITKLNEKVKVFQNHEGSCYYYHTF